VEFFFYHRDRVGSTPLREELNDAHLAYMDRFADGIIARGPTFADEEVLTGSVHIVDLPSVADARTFAFDEPNYQAGAYRDVMVRRWRNLLGRTMWDFGDHGDGGKYLVVGLGSGPLDERLPDDADALIAYGPLLSDDGGTWVGTAALVTAPDPEAARSILDARPYADIEVHNWVFGGRR
jgi:uncharacterized protein YciI